MGYKPKTNRKDSDTQGVYGAWRQRYFMAYVETDVRKVEQR